MAIPSRQIGGSTRTNLLWQISKQLEQLICVRAGGCPTTTTTTSTISPDTIVNSTNKFVNCPAICPQACPNPQVYFDVWMTYNCALFFPEIGCAIWLDEAATIPFPDGSYNKGYGVCLTITGGIITADQ